MSHAVSLTCTMKADGEPARMLLDVMQKCRQRLRFKTLVEYCRAAAFSRCGNVFFPLQQLFGLQSWAFSAASFFLPQPVFFLPRTRTSFFPPRTVFPRCLQNVFFCCKGAFLLLLGVFSAALNFSRCEAAFFADIFPRCKNSFFPLQGVFFLLPST